MVEEGVSTDKLRLRNIVYFSSGVCIVLWYFAISGIVKLLTGGRETYGVYLCLLLIPLVYFYIDDFSISELLGGSSGTNAAAGVTASMSVS